MAPITQLERVQKVFEALNTDYVSHEQFAGLLRSLFEAIKKEKDDYSDKLDQKTLEYLRRYNSITDLFDESVTKLEAEITQKADGRQTRDQFDRIRTELRKVDAGIRADLPDMPDLAPIELQLVRLKEAIPPKVDGPAIWKALDDFYTEFQGYAKEMTSLRNNHAPGIRVFGGARGFQLLVDGAKKGQVNYVNLVAGNGVTLSYNQAHGRNDITFNAAGGGSLSVLTATGAVDDSNTSFTFASTPTLVMVNGAAYRDGHGCAISGTSVTLDNPVGTGGDIYALG